MIRTVFAWAVLTVSGAVPALAEAPLHWKYKEGGKSETEVETKTHQLLTLGTVDVETKTEVFSVVRTSAGKRQSDGTLRVTQEVQTLQVQMELPGGMTLAFSSTDPDKKADNAELEPLLQVLRVTARAPKTLVLDKDNRIEKVEIDPKKVEGLDERFKGLFDPETLKKAASQELAVLPGREVKKGDHWERTAELAVPGGQSLTFTTRYEYLGEVKKEGKTLDKIGFSATKVTLAMTGGGDSPVTIQDSELKIKDAKGHLLFDRAAGQVVEQQDRTHITG
jgi:hypothetical protein